jgi:hypothetical protein
LTRPKSKQPQLTTEERELSMIRSKGQFKAKTLNKRLFSERLSISSAAINSQDEGRKSAPPQMTTQFKEFNLATEARKSIAKEIVADEAEKFVF